MLKIRSKIGIVCCSNGQPYSNKEKIDDLIHCLKRIGFIPVCSAYIYQKDSVFSGTGEERARALMDFYEDESIKAIFDISGGDLANEILNYLDFGKIKRNPKPFWGYSDLTTVINGIYAKTQNASYLYQIRNLVSQKREEQIGRFTNSVLHNQGELFQAEYEFLQGEEIRGIVIGGNVRCFLKLAGTSYMPKFQDKILFLESFGGEVAQMTTYLNQLKQMNVFHEISGILLGTFLTMERNNCVPTMEELVIGVVNDPELPIAKTREIGHGDDSKCLVIGGAIEIKRI